MIPNMVLVFFLWADMLKFLIIDESFDTDHVKTEPKPWEFRSKPPWQRLIILIGGVTELNLGFLIYSMVLFIWGK